MEPGVPFALLAVAELLAVTACAGLGAVVLFPRLRRPSSFLLALGAFAVAAAEALTGSTIGEPTSERLAWLRAAGAIFVAAGLVQGAPRFGPRELPLPSASAPTLALVPLGATLPPTLTAAIAFAVAAALAARQAVPGRGVLAGGLLLYGAASAAGVSAETSATSAVAVLVLRLAASLAIIAWLATLATRSVLAKVVGSILLGVVTTAVAVASIVGTAIVSRLTTQQRTQVDAIARTVSADIQQQASSLNAVAASLAASNAPQAFALSLGKACGNNGTAIAAQVSLQGVVDPYPTHCGDDISSFVLGDLANSPLVLGVASHADSIGGEGIVVLQGGTKPFVLALAAQHVPGTAAARVVGVELNDTILAARKQRTLLDVTLIPLDSAVAASSSLPPHDLTALVGDSRVRAALASPPGQFVPRVEVSQGREPTIAMTTLYAGATQPTTLLVVSAPAATVLGVQRTILRVLFGALVAIALVLGLGGLGLGAQVVGPVQALTRAAEALRRGEPGSRAGVRTSDEVGVLARTFDVMRDDLEAAAEALRVRADQESSLRSRLETVLASITDGLVVADEEGLVTSINPAAVAMLGRTGDTAGTPLARVLTGVSIDGRPFAGTGRRQVEGVIARSDGVTTPVVVTTEPLTDGRGVVVVLRDTTRERQVERMKTEFLSNVSHELRTPLTPIQGYAEILRRKGRDLSASQQTSYAEIVLDSSKRLGRVVDLLVDVAALDAGRVTADLQDVALGSFVDARLTAWRARAAGRGADLRRRVAAGLGNARVDPILLAKVVDELVDNALKFSEPGTAVTISAAQGTRAGELVLSVSDKGVGIDDDARAELFSDFIQADGSATRARDGLGLGLAFARRLVDVLGARLEVESTPGRGSTFSVVLPAAGARRRVPGPRRSAARS
ncbi:MAG TPA: ATP-binding protein [Mycobacteriales bacterium]|nr:ATP-binding protein [Mycobacteriales bacterium]